MSEEINFKLDAAAFESIISRGDAASEAATEKMAVKRSKSVKKLHFEHKADDHPLKTVLVEKINERNLTYRDLLNFCVALEGDDKRGLGLGNNIINCLRSRNSLSLPYLTTICKFLNLEIRLVEVKEEEPKKNDE